MRGLKVICGVAVLVMSLHMVHAIHHFHHMQGEMSPPLFWGLMGLGIVMDLLSFTGGVLLLVVK